MGLLLDLLTLPLLGAPRLVRWTAMQVAAAAEQDEGDEGKLQGRLLDLQMRYELGEIDNQAYYDEETALLARLDAIRQAKGRDEVGAGV